jgi:hypothetical protein
MKLFEGVSIFVLSIFLCCLLFIDNELCFTFFMEWAALHVDQFGVLCCLWMGCVMNDSGWQSIRRSFQFGEAKFLSSKSNECLLVYVCLSVGVWKMQIVSGCGEG